MAKKTYKVEVNSAVKRQALEALLVALGFDKTGPDAFVDTTANTAKKTTTRVIKPVKKKPQAHE